MLIRVEMMSFFLLFWEMNYTGLLCAIGMGCQASAAASSSSELM
jgi:hypothetical protein